MIRKYPPIPAILAAYGQALKGPCQKSQRGISIYSEFPNGNIRIEATGTNHPPGNRFCSGSESCRTHCSELCIHAESDALKKLSPGKSFLHVVHLKVFDGKILHSGPPSCWQCARDLLDNERVKSFWLLHESGWRNYSINEFYTLTMKKTSLPILGRSL